ncbi:MAG: DUF4350 domain-containing protein, partial [Candidatus Thorarchaeota archaeon]
MKKSMLTSLLVLLFLFSMAAPAGIIVSSDSTELGIVDNASSLSQTTTVLIDESHSALFTSDSLFNNFTTDMIAQGYSVEVMDTWDVTQLSGADVLVTCCPQDAYTSDDFYDIHAFVAKGGGLFIIGDAAGVTTADELAVNFGAVFSPGFLEDLDDSYSLDSWIRYDGVANFGDHPITQGVSNVSTYAGYGITRFPPDAVPIVMMDADGQSEYSTGDLASGVPAIVAFEYARGLGRIVVAGDSNQFLGNDLDGDGQTSYFERNNEVLARNIINWLATPDIPDQIVAFDESHASLYNIDSNSYVIDVVFDESHSPFFGIDSNDNGIYGDDAAQYGDWASYLEGAGYDVEKMSTFSSLDLSINDVIVLPNPASVYSAGEQENILEAVRQGRGLLVLAEGYGWLRDGSIQIADLFGAEFYDGVLNDTDDQTYAPTVIRLNESNLADHPILNGVNDVVYNYGTGLKEIPDNAVPILVTDNDGTNGWEPPVPAGDPSADNVPLAITFEYGKGRVAMIGESSLFITSPVDVLHEGNNSLFGINLIRWLAGGRMHSPYYHAARALEDAGYGVASMLEFDETFLDDTDALVLCAPSTPYIAAEKLVMQNYVESEGNGLFLIGEYTFYGDVIRDVAADFGFFFDSGGLQLYDDDDYADFIDTGRFTLDATNVESHVITSGVDELLWRRGNGFSSLPTGADVLLKMDDDVYSKWENGTAAAGVPMMAALEYGRGRIVTIGDTNLWDGENFEDAADGNDYTRDIDNYDNKRLLTNTLDWLTANRAPTVEVLTPNGGELINSTYSVTWTTDDFDGDSLSSTLYYSTDSGSTWNTLASAGGNTTYSWDTTAVPNSAEYLIRVEVSDGDLTAQDESDAVFEVSNGFVLDLPWWFLPAVAGGALVL